LGRYACTPYPPGMTKNMPPGSSPLVIQPERATVARTSVALVHDPEQGVQLTATVPPASLAKLKAAVLWVWAKVLPLIAAYLLGKST